jgi:hypothetical protein
LHKFRKERRSPRGCFECGDTTHFIADCPKRKKFDSNKYNYNNQNDSSDKGKGKKKYRFGDKKKKKKKFQKIMSRACAALSDLEYGTSVHSATVAGEQSLPSLWCQQCMKEDVGCVLTLTQVAM